MDVVIERLIFILNIDKMCGVWEEERRSFVFVFLCDFNFGCFYMWERCERF